MPIVRPLQTARTHASHPIDCIGDSFGPSASDTASAVHNETPFEGRLAGRRAAVVVASYYGSDPRVRRAADAMVRAGMVLDVFCLQDPDEQLPQPSSDSVRVYRFPLTRQRTGKLRYFFEYGVFFAWAFWKLSFAHLRRAYDLVHVHNLPDMLVFSSLVPKLMGAKIILDMHDPTPELCRTIFGIPPGHLLVRSAIMLEKLAVRFADVVFTPNVAFKQLFSERTGLPGKIHIIMNSPSEKIFKLPSRAEVPARETGSAPRGFRLMYHGLIAERHGLDLLISAVKSLSKDIPALHLDIYGRPNQYLELIRKLIDVAGIGQQVTYHGYRALEEIAQIIEDIDLGVIPNRGTPFTEINLPTRIFEYLAVGRPVVVPNTRGIRDYFQSNEVLYFTPNDVADLTRVIRWTYENREQTREIVNRGMRVYRQHLWDSQKSQLLGIVGDLIGAAPVRT